MGGILTLPPERRPLARQDLSFTDKMRRIGERRSTQKQIGGKMRPNKWLA